MKDIFNKLVQEFGLHTSINADNELIGKLPGFAGFLIAATDKNIMVATKVSEPDNENGPFFYGADGFNNYDSARAQVAKMVKLAKENFVSKNMEKIKTDFNCKSNFT